MKTKLTPLALLIPAVVLAQPAPMPSSQAITPSSSTMPAPAVNPAKAADALNTAKQLSSKLNSDSSKDCNKNSKTIHYTKNSYTCVTTGD